LNQICQSPLETARDVAQIVGALGTLLAVLVALFGSQIRRLIFKPRLDISLSPNGGSLSDAPYFKDENKNVFLPSLWYHLRVSNPNQFQPIMEVYVYLIKIESLDASGKYVVVSREELPMRWRYAGKPNPPRNFGHPELVPIDRTDWRLV
jgi:hypothetical protein